MLRAILSVALLLFAPFGSFAGNVPAGPAAHQPDRQTALLLHLDGDARDSSGAEGHGEVKGRHAWAEGRFGKSLRLEGQGGVVIAPSGALHVGSQSWTVECWFKPDPGQQGARILVGGGWGHERDYYLGIGDNVLFASFSAGPLSGAVRSPDLAKVLYDGHWHHAAAVLDRGRAGEVRLYLDGRRISPETRAFCPPIEFDEGAMGVVVGATAPWYVGKEGYRGLIDEVRISSAVRPEYAAEGPLPEEALARAKPRPRFEFDPAASRKPLELSPHNTVIALPELGVSQGNHDAAAELQQWLRKASGAATGFDILPESKVGPVEGRTIIALGRSRWLADDEIAGLSPAGFLIRRKANVVCIAGGAGTGAYLGAVRFLDRACGVRFYMPTDLFTSVAAGKPVIQGELEVRIEPFVGSAMMSGLVGVPGDGGWAKRNGAARRLGGTHQHSMYDIFPPARFAQRCPEIYPILGGKRHVPADASDQQWQPCLSEPKLLDCALESCRLHFRRFPSHLYVAVSVQDGHRTCECPKCNAAYEGFKAAGRPEAEARDRGFSKLYWQFIAALAGRLEAEAPGKKLVALVYGPARFPPDSAMPANVVLFTNFHVAELDADRILAPEAATGVSPLDEVLSRARTYGNHDWYHGNGFLVPRIYSGYWSRFMRALAAKADGAMMHAEAYPNWGLDGPKLYITARLWQEPGLDVEELLGQFCGDMFGPAAAPMRAYFTELEKLWIALDNVKGPERKLFQWGRQFLADADDLAAVRRCRGLLEEAAKLAATEDERRRVALFSDTFRVSESLYEMAAAESVAKDRVEQFRRHVETKIIPNPMTLYRAADNGADLKKHLEGALSFATAAGKKVR